MEACESHPLSPQANSFVPSLSAGGMLASVAFKVVAVGLVAVPMELIPVPVVDVWALLDVSGPLLALVLGNELVDN